MQHGQETQVSVGGITLSRKTLNFLTCDNCDRETATSPLRHVEQEPTALREGWKVGLYQTIIVHLCPKCVLEFPEWWDKEVVSVPKDDDFDDED